MCRRFSVSHRRCALSSIIALSFFIGIFIAGCGGKEDTPKAPEPSTPETPRQTMTEYLLPTASGAESYGNEVVSVDISNTSEGYFMVRYSGSAEKARIQVGTPDGDTYSYVLRPGDYEAFPLSCGDGTYQIDVYEHVYDNKYALSFSQSASVALSDEFKPFLYPNQYVWFTADSEVVAYGRELSGESSDDLSYVEKVFNYVINNVTYDTELAKDIPTEYLPDNDKTLQSGTGICFDYASLMSAFLRSQGIPTKLVVGYSGTTYHAWISVYLKESGWVDNMIQFDGNDWSLMDPTLAASNDEDAVREYVGDGSNYIVKYSY